MVLSKLRTLTVDSVMSSTVPLAPALLTVIQSPLRTMLLLVRRMPATSPVMESLNTSISTADVAPSPARRVSGLRSMMIEMMIMTPRNSTIIFNTPQKECRYCWVAERLSLSLSKSLSELIKVVASRIVAMVMYIAVALRMRLCIIGWSENIGGISIQTIMAGTMLHAALIICGLNR